MSPKAGLDGVGRVLDGGKLEPILGLPPSRRDAPRHWSYANTSRRPEELARLRCINPVQANFHRQAVAQDGVGISVGDGLAGEGLGRGLGDEGQGEDEGVGYCPILLPRR